MYKTKNREEFGHIISDLWNDPDVQALKEMSQHNKDATRLDHCVYVAYLSFLACRRLGLDHVAAARAGLLHDFHFDDKDSAGIRRLWQHPRNALENASEKYALSPLEKDIIVKHMWPLTPRPPRHKESFIVSMADKLCALMEFTLLYRLLRVQKKLVPLAA